MSLKDMLGDAQGFADLEPRKLLDLVQALWEQRESIPLAVAFVREHGDTLVKAGSFVADHGDDVARLLRELPAFAGQAGRAIRAAGDGLAGAAQLLAGDPAKSDDGVFALVGIAADALSRCREELHAATGLLGALADHLGDIRIPSIEARYDEILGHRLLTGIDLGESPIADRAAEVIRGGAGRLDGIGGQLDTVADRLRELGSRLGSTGGDLHGVAQHLIASGDALAGLGGGGAVGSAAAPAGGPVLRLLPAAAVKPVKATVRAKSPAKKPAAAAKKSARRPS